MIVVWQPEPEILDAEVLGRQIHRSASAQPHITIDSIEIGDFYDSREDKDLSFDRLGPGSAIKKVRKYITRIVDADLSSQDQPKVFVGWCAANAIKWKFPNFEGYFYWEPTKNEDGSVKNKYHSNLCRDGYRQKGSAYALATTLWHQANRKGWVEEPAR